MSKDQSRIHLPTAAVLFFVASFLVAGAGLAVDLGHLPGVGQLVVPVAAGLLVGAWVPLGLLIWRKSMKTAATFLTRYWHLELTWISFGMQIFGVASLTSRTTPPSLFSNVMAGPLSCGLDHNGVLALVLVAAETGAFAFWLKRSEVAHTKDGKAEYLKTARKLADAVAGGIERAPKEQPGAGHLVSTRGPVAAYIISEEERATRIGIGVADLARDWGKRKEETRVGLPREGSGIVVGSPGAGKSNLIQSCLLEIEGRDHAETGSRHTKLIVTSTKPEDLAAPTVDWLREQGFDVRILDLTGTITAEDTRYGTVTRWSPVSAASSFDAATKIAKRVLESARGSHDRVGESRFWLEQAVLLVSPCLYAANIEGADFETALGWVQQWDASNFNEVDHILSSHAARIRLDIDRNGTTPEKVDDLRSATSALDKWIGARKLVLAPAGEHLWTADGAAPAGATTGANIRASLEGFLLELTTKEAYAATADPNFSPHDWVHTDGDTCLFLIGNMNNPIMTAAILSTLISDLIHEAGDLANRSPGGRLPYRLVGFFDELANLAPIPDLGQIYSTARSRGMQFLGFFQSYAQAERIYGREVAHELLDSSTAILVMSGVKDPTLISVLQTVGGAERTELNEGHTVEVSLIGGHHVTSMQAPNGETGEPGDGLLIVRGGVIKVRIPFWAKDETLRERGVIPEHLREKVAQWEDDGPVVVQKVRKQISRLTGVH